MHFKLRKIHLPCKLTATLCSTLLPKEERDKDAGSGGSVTRVSWVKGDEQVVPQLYPSFCQRRNIEEAGCPSLVC